jgi:hypothetical protein
MRLAKLWFRFRHLLEAGLVRPAQISYELFRIETGLQKERLSRPSLGL